MTPEREKRFDFLKRCRRITKQMIENLKRASEDTKKINQCDGCCAGWPIDKNGIHIPPNAKHWCEYIVCTKNRYK